MSDCKFGGNRRICYETSCNSCHLRSFASHKKSKYLLNVDPRKITLHCNRKYWFKCNKCTHEFDSRISDVVDKNRWCPYCCIPQQKLCTNLDCDHCYKRSLASHWCAEFIVGADPRQIMRMSHKKYWFKCKNNHDFDSALNNINAGYWCPYCLYKRENECKIIFERLFKRIN